MFLIRGAVFAIFIAMMFVVKQALGYSVATFGLWTGFVFIAGAALITFKMENRDRKRDGRPPYTWVEARHDAMWPLIGFLAILAIAFLLR